MNKYLLNNFHFIWRMTRIFLYIIPHVFNFPKITSIEKNRVWDSDPFTSEPFNLIILTL